MTVGDLVRHLSAFDAGDELVLGDDHLSFYRLKKRGAKLVQMEFNELLEGETDRIVVRK